MIYKDFQDLKLSALGMGMMRLPVKGTGEVPIDEKQAAQMIDYAIEHGVNYFDTAWGYHNGQSEITAGKLLGKYPRDRYYLADKFPGYDLSNMDKVEEIFEKQLEKCQTEYFDFYLFHNVCEMNIDSYLNEKYGILDYLLKQKEVGRIRHLGFSFHDTYEAFEEVLRGRDWDFCQIQYNYMDTEEQAGDKGYALAEELGIPLVIMEPVKGGSLANFSDDINAKFKAMDKDASIASWAFRWVGSHSNAKVILSGMSSEEQVEDNLKTFSNFKPLDEAEEKMISEIVSDLQGRVQNGCTGCRYCMPCPAGVNIPQNFALWNKYHIYGTYDHVKNAWEKDLKDEEKAKCCVKCGKCEKVCPQHLSIRRDLELAQKDLDSAAAAQE